MLFVKLNIPAFWACKLRSTIGYIAKNIWEKSYKQRKVVLLYIIVLINFNFSFFTDFKTFVTELK